MSGRRAVTGLIAVLATAPAVGAEPAPPAPRQEALRPVHLMPGSGWKGGQFLQADKKGRLFLLRASPLQVFPMTGTGELGEPTSLSREALNVPVGASMVITAAMSRNGDWLIQDGFQPRVFRGGKEEAVARLSWIIGGTVFLGDEPVIAGSPMTVDHARETNGELPDEVGLVARWGGREWDPMVFAPTGRSRPDPATLAEQRMVRLAGSSDGHLWLAYDFRHRFREYSRGGRLLTEIVVGDGEARPAADAEARAKKLAEEGRWLSSGTTSVSPFEVTAAPVVRALAEGRDGRMYFLVRGESEGEAEMALERYEAASGELQRLPLAMPDPGRASMAAGKGGLYVAAFNPQRGIWQVTWERLEAASWTTVEATVTSGQGGGVSPPAEAAEKPRPARGAGRSSAASR